MLSIPSLQDLLDALGKEGDGNKLEIDIPKDYQEVWNSQAKYLVLKGGRGSAKTMSIIAKIMERIVEDTDPFNVLFLREFLKNVSELKDLFLDIADQYNIKFRSRNKDLVYKDKIIYFRGAREPTSTSVTRMLSTLNRLKNIPNLRYILLDEAQDNTENTLDVLIPTARTTDITGKRKRFSPRFIFCMNPKTDNDPVLLFANRRPENSIIIHRNIDDIEERFQNPDLLKEAEYSKKYDSKDKYEHIWLGKGSPLIQNPFAKVEILKDLPAKQWERFYAWVDPAFVGYGKACTAVCGLVKLERDNNLYIFGEMFEGAWHAHMDDIYNFINKDNRWLFSNIDGITTVYYESNSIGSHLRKIYHKKAYGERTIIPIQTLGNKEVKIASKSYLHADIKLISNFSHDNFIKNVLEYELGAKSKIDGIDAMCSLLEHLGL